MLPDTPAPVPAVPEGLTSPQYSALAVRALEEASKGWADVDRKRERSAHWLAIEVAAEDPELQDRVLRAMPASHERRQRSETIAATADIPHLRIFDVLKALQSRGEATTAGGWWRRADSHTLEETNR